MLAWLKSWIFLPREIASHRTEVKGVLAEQQKSNALLVDLIALEKSAIAATQALTETLKRISRLTE